MRRICLLVCFVLFTTIAQADLVDFETALDDWELKKAQSALQSISEANMAALCKAEFYLKKSRPELALGALQSLQPSALKGEQRGKFFLLKALLEQTRYEGTNSQRTSGTMRFVRDGLRSNPSPRDRSRLLLLRIETAPADKLALAEEAESELAELESVSDSTDLMAQAMLLVRKGRHSQAARLWSNLATIAGSRGKSQSQGYFQYKEIEALKDAGKVEAAQQLKDELFNRAVQKKDPLLSRLVWKAESSSPRGRRLELSKVLYEALEPSEEKLRLLAHLASSETERASKMRISEEGIENARQLQDPILQAYFLSRTALYSGSGTKKDRLNSEVGAILKNYNLDHLRGVWYGSLHSALKGYNFISSKDLSVEKLEKAVEASGKDGSNKVAAQILGSSLLHVKPAVAFPALERFMKSLEPLPQSDKLANLNLMRSKLYFGATYYKFSSPPGNRDRARSALGAALLEEAENSPSFISQLIDTYLTSLDNERDPEKLGLLYQQLAQWMGLLNRSEEARDLLNLALSLNLKTQRRELLELELFLNRNSTSPLTAAQVNTLAGLKQSVKYKPWSVYCESGWLDLHCGRPREAEKWAQKALAESSNESIYDFLGRGPYRLLAHAKAAQGQTEEAISILDQAEKRYPLESSKFLLSRALILSAADRHKEAYIATLGIQETSSPDLVILAHTLRFSSAAASNRKEIAEKAKADLEAFMEEDLQLSREPQYAPHLRAEFSEEFGEKVTLPSTNSEFRGLANVMERLEALRRREPGNQTLRRLGAAEIRGLTETAGSDEVFVQPILLRHSVVLLSAVKGNVCLQEVICDRKKVEQALLSLSTKLSSPSIDVNYASADQEYLSRVLVRPWQSLFPNKTKLRWLGENALKSVPLSALPDTDGEPLVIRFSLAYLDGPGISELKLSAKLPALVVGGATDLPGAAKELQTVRAAFSRGREWKLGQKFGALKKFAGEHQVVHFATHGKAPSEKELAASLSGGSQRLSAFQLAELSFPENSLAVLGACESYVDAKTGRDNTSLVSALRTAGAKVVVGSFWRLDDKVTADLFDHFYTSLRQGVEPDLALAQAQRTLMTQKAHPYYWAGLQVVSGP